MRKECEEAVTAAAKAMGRGLNKDKIAAIETEVLHHFSDIAAKDRELPAGERVWLGLSKEDKSQMVFSHAAEAIEYKAQRRIMLAEMQIVANERVMNEVKGIHARGEKRTESKSYIKFLGRLRSDSETINKQALAQLNDLLNAAKDTDGQSLLRKAGMKIFGLDNPGMTRDIVREVWMNADGHTGNKAAKLAAQAYLSVIKQMRERFNRAGGDMEELSYGYVTQTHDVVKMGKDGDAWARDVIGLVDRDRYVTLDGKRMSDAQLLPVLAKMHTTITTHGLDGKPYGQGSGRGMVAEQGSARRALHFKDGDAWIAYMSKYGEGSLYDAMMQHISGASRSIAMLEGMGPDPGMTHKIMADMVKRKDAPHGAQFKEVRDGREYLFSPDNYFDIASGHASSPENRAFASFMQGARNIQTASKIVWGPLSAVADVATIVQSLNYHQIPYLDMFRAYGRQFNKEHRATLRTHEVIAESVASSINRWAGDNIAHGWTGHVTNGVMRLSGMNLWTDMARTSFADALMSNMVTMAKKDWGALTEWDRMRLETQGVSKADWDVINKIEFKGGKAREFLSPKAVRDIQGIDAATLDRVATNLARFVHEESVTAVVNPDIFVRSIVTFGGQRAGTIPGEIARTLFQFKAFPMSVITRHWDRMFTTPQGLAGAPRGYGAESKGGEYANRVALAAGFMLSTTICGAIQVQARNAVLRKEPLPMDPSDEHGRKFWLKATMAGGGASFVGDVLTSPLEDPGRTWQSKIGMLGPLPGAVIGGPLDIIHDKRHRAATAYKVVYDNLPFVDTLPMKIAFEHWTLHMAQESLSPGYGARMQQRAKKVEGTEYWHKPGEVLPEFME